MVGLLAAAGAVMPAAARSAVPKVVLIVGPVGSVTPYYRGLAEQAATVAEQAGAEVVRVYSPNATWPAVKAAVDGASIVVYLGHGNGWPSRYRDSLYPPTQNGFGLNPVAGQDDTAHQYFGESHVEDLNLAPHAVVLLNHLCYASGNTEPGLPQGTRDQAVQRVDNYAAGFLRAGAAAVVAEGHLGPAYYVGALLSGHRSIEQIWRGSPERHGHEFAVASDRSPGYVERLDPDRTSGGYYRSLVTKGKLDAAQVRAGGTGELVSTVAPVPAEPTLANLNLEFGMPALRAMPVAGTKSRLTLPLTKAELASLPQDLQVGVRWDPILVDTPQPTPAAGNQNTTTAGGPPDAAATPGASSAPSPSASNAAAPSAGPSASPDPHASSAPDARASSAPDPHASSAPDVAPSATPTDPAATPADPPTVDLVAAEQIGSVVQLAKGKHGSKGLVIDVRYPAAPGLYRLVATLHDGDDVAYDATTQALLTPMLVKVGGPVAAAFGTASSVVLATGSPATLPIRVVNVGSKKWDTTVTAAPTRISDEPGVDLHTETLPARLVATWVSAEGKTVPAAVTRNLDEKVAAPGGQQSVHLEVTPPTEPGAYLLLIDVVSPAFGPLSAQGSAPAVIRVTVEAAPPEPSPMVPPAASGAIVISPTLVPVVVGGGGR